MNIQNLTTELHAHALSAQQPSPANTDSISHLNPINARDRLTQQIKTHRGLSVEDHLNMSNKLSNNAFSLSGLYHTRTPELNQLPLFFSDFETEKPELNAVRLLSDKAQAFYETRHNAKRGRDLHTDLPIEGANSQAGQLKTSPYLKTQTWGGRAIRSEAATATVDHYINIHNNYSAQLHAHVIQQLAAAGQASGGKVHLVRPTRDPYSSDATLNFLTFCTQTEVARTLNTIEQKAAKAEGRRPMEFTDYKSCVTLTRTARTEASPIGRLVQQGYFATDEIDVGDHVVIVDDHVQAGSSILAMAAAVKEAGANILGFCAPTTHPYCNTLQMHELVKQSLIKTLKEWDPEHLVLNELQNMGMPVDTLTNAEALILIAYATNPHDEHALRTFKDLDALLINGRSVMEGEHDSLAPILNQTPEPPNLFAANMKHLAKDTRSIVKNNPVTQVEVLDWDSCLTNEKGMNYQLMYNALAVAAHEHAHKYPELQDINKAVRPYIEGEGYQEGMPKWCMGSTRFTEFGIMNPQFWKKHMVVDLLDKLHTVAPQLHIDAERKASIISIIQHEFNRQYKAFTRPPIPQEVQERMQALEQAKGIERPFKQIELKFMPGVHAFLENHRKPNTRMLLISNKRDHDLHNEVNKLGVAHYFDHISGVATVSENGNVISQGGKPKPDRLKHALETLALSHRSLRMRLVGDQMQDILQGDALSTDPRKQMTGLLVAPNRPADLPKVTPQGISVHYAPTLELAKTQIAMLRPQA